MQEGSLGTPKFNIWTLSSISFLILTSTSKCCWNLGIINFKSPIWLSLKDQYVKSVEDKFLEHHVIESKYEFWQKLDILKEAYLLLFAHNCTMLKCKMALDQVRSADGHWNCQFKVKRMLDIITMFRPRKRTIHKGKVNIKIVHYNEICSILTAWDLLTSMLI